ncbi:Hsp20/alpha crystallin family protein, partial [Patescibacteria group bacterium]|nr:Hsp20/alpha crystallin family protein [Patescibacteria group bacterium]
MPIKWQPFKESEGPLDFPGVPGAPGMPIPEEGWIPFLPNQKAEEPAIDIHQDKNNLYVEISLVGINPKNVEISIEDNILVIQGKSEEEKE